LKKLPFWNFYTYCLIVLRLPAVFGCRLVYKPVSRKSERGLRSPFK
jgi:hypothetical protein